MVKHNKPKRAAKQRRPSSTRVSMHTGTRHSNIQHYLGYLNHQHNDVKSLRPPASTSRRIARWSSWSRTLATSGDAGTQTLVFGINPMRFTEGTVWKGNTAGQALPAGFQGVLTNTNQFAPGSFGSAVLPSEGAYLATDGAFGNHFGARRWVGATFHVRYLGTNFNAGGEITLVHDDTAGGIAGSTSDNVRAHPRARRFALPANGRVVSINVFPSGEGAAFFDLNRYNTVGSSAVDSAIGGDPRVYGDSNITFSTPPVFGKGDVPLGWNTALLINPAADNQRYEVTIEIQYEGQMAYVSNGSNDANTQRIQKIPITETTIADPDGAALVDTLTHSHVLRGPNTNRPQHSFQTSLAAAMAAVAPLAKRVAIGYATKAIEGLGM